MVALVPQIDRVCMSRLVGEQVHFIKLAQPPILNAKIGGIDYRVSANNSALALYILDPKPIVNGNLNSVQGEDIARISLVMKSSYHVPVRIGGEQVYMNFWSREENAFPPAAQAFLKQMAELATKNAKMPSPEREVEPSELSQR
jgi:hypothetical protein